MISGQVGIWLMIASASLLIYNHLIYYQERQTILDMRDAQIEARFFSEALSGESAAETAGFVVMESSIKLVDKDVRLSEAFDNLSDELKSLLDAPPDVQAEGIE